MKRFWATNNYLRVSIYAIWVIIISILFYRVSSNTDNIVPSILNFFKRIETVISPILSGLIIAYLFNPIMSFFEKILSNITKPKTTSQKKMIRSLSIVLLYLFIFGSLILMVRYLIPQILVNIRDLANMLPRYIDEFNVSLKNLESNINSNIISLPYQMDTRKIFDMISPEKYFDSERINTIISRVLSQAFTITSSVFNWFMAFVISFYALEQKEAFARGAKRMTYTLFTESNANRITDAFKEGHAIFIRFFVGKFIDSFIIGVICFIGLSIIKNPYALLLAVIVGVFNMIPYFGPFIGAVPAILITLFEGFLPAVTVAGFIFLLQQFDGLILGPKILGDSIGLSPFWIISSIIVGGALWGPLGMFFASPLIAIILLTVNRWMDKRLAYKKINLSFSSINSSGSPPDHKEKKIEKKRISPKETTSTDGTPKS